MQLFQCHYRERALLSGLYFDSIQAILQAAASEGASGLSCQPPPCPNLHAPPGAALICISFFFFLILKGCLEGEGGSEAC